MIKSAARQTADGLVDKPGPTRAFLEKRFDLRARGTTWRTEVLAGATTFLTMAYIVFVNPAILGEAGMPVAAVAVATCLSAAIGSILMGLVANYPLALAPGMGLNAYFTYTVVKGMGVPWQTALGCVFLSGCVFLVLTAAGIRQLIVNAIPRELFAAVAAGVGLFIAFVGLRDAGIIVPSSGTTVAMGNLRAPQTALALLGLLLIAGLQAWGVRTAMLWGIMATTVAGIALGIVHWAPAHYRFADMTATAFHLDIRAALHLKGSFGAGLLEIIFVFLFVDLFDNVGTLVAVTKKTGLVRQTGEIPRLNQILFADAAATILGSLAGTSTVVTYIESAAGVAIGGRTGIASIVTGLLFLAALFVAPLVAMIPAAATSPALILVGSLMISAVSEIEWADPMVAVPAFLTMITIPLTFSIANGLAFGITSFALLRLLRGQAMARDWMLYLLAALFLLRFLYMAKSY
ncbi:MAG TPA: NCS2 family permease [Acidobacteriaceae bacterium]|nr:NCS2 family permease [Acidobacteriaceae bacterium]